MDQGRWQRIDNLFQDALLIDPGVREQELRLWCQGDEALFQEVQAMLFYHDQSEDFLDQPFTDRAFELIAKAEEDHLPEIMGPYRVERFLAHGGMGSVYIARQLDPIERTVAIKVINTREADFLQRFHYERQVLALLRHPNVANVYDAGQTTDGFHFFSMEYVEGKDLLTFCDDERLGIDARLELFKQVCDGVAHAHRKGVIHRDLKPSNIIVNTDEEKPMPKIIDFGIAQRVSESNQISSIASVMGTPAYMSPECFRGEQADTTADVYALGVILYQLLAGRMPFKEELYQNSSKAELGELLMNTEIASPSASMIDVMTLQLAELRSTHPKALRRNLRGDLDAIVLKALQPQPRDRYLSVEALVTDIQRHQNGQTVSAHPSTLAYTILKAIKRDRRKASIVFSFVLAIVTSVAALYVGKTEAEAANRRNKAMKEASNNLLMAADPRMGLVESKGPFLEEAERQIDATISNKEDKATMLIVLGDVLAAWGEDSRAIGTFQKAIDLTADDPDLVNTYQRARLSQAYSLVQGDNAEKGMKTLLELRSWASKFGAHSLENMRVTRGIADAYRSLEYKDDAVQAYATYFGLCTDEMKKTPDYLGGRANYARLILDKDPAEALLVFTEVRDVRMKTLSENHPDTLFATHGIGWCLINLGRYDEATFYVKSAFEKRKLCYGLNNIHTLASFHNFILLQSKLKSTSDDEMVSLYLELVEMKIHLNQFNNSTLRTMSNLASRYNKVNEFERALTVLGETQQHMLENKINDAELESAVVLTYAEIFENMGDPDVAMLILGDNMDHTMVYIDSIEQMYLSLRDSLGICD